MCFPKSYIALDFKSETAGRPSASLSSNELSDHTASLIASFRPFVLVKFRPLCPLQMLLLVAVLKHLLIGRRWVVAVGWRRRIAHHLMRRARLGWVHRVCQGDPWVPDCHSVYPKALHTSWLLGHWNGDKTRVVFSKEPAAYSDPRLYKLFLHKGRSKEGNIVKLVKVTIMHLTKPLILVLFLGSCYSM